jgi:hypothetical protein
MSEFRYIIDKEYIPYLTALRRVVLTMPIRDGTIYEAQRSLL